MLEENLKILQDNPTLVIEVQGHTDAIGTDEYNMRLSQARAAAVKKWMVDRGISPDRLVAKGYGESMPIASNSTKEGRQKNRRVVFKILSK